jgi:hypothetical protein
MKNVGDVAMVDLTTQSQGVSSAIGVASFHSYKPTLGRSTLFSDSAVHRLLYIPLVHGVDYR